MCLYKSIDDIKQANLTSSVSQGKAWWFEQGAMEWFNTQIHNKVYHGCYFITSEKFELTQRMRDLGMPEMPRKYTVRLCTQDGLITTISEFQQYQSLQDAEQAIQAIAGKTTVTDTYGAQWNIPDNCPDVKECES